ncbi:pre-mRNA processing factor 3-domain-containing protein [Naematelia encephala]|uniref:Pre-mRNA processing factor 3-domain-containing protein n=1 Tax=Naematelia encephala TaxID=71784 RepID=A0A1Y2ALJ8_9TREE|nr:pre-mRNA processing factor 3-domain-containing protein [Naematelia encephala]
MSSRRPADGPAPSEPASKLPKLAGGAGLDMAAIRAQLAAKRAEVEARLKGSSPAPAPAGPPPTTSTGTPPGRTTTPSAAPGPSALPPAPKMDASVAERLAAAKARVEAMNARMKNPYLSGSGSMPKTENKETPVGSMTSVSVALHPLLMAEQKNQEQIDKANEKKRERDRYKTMAPKFSTVKANQSSVQASQATRESPMTSVVLNPYASTPTSGASPAAPGEGSAAGRKSRKLQFASAGRFIRQGDALRNEQKMDALRARIAAASAKAGLDAEFNTLERSLKRQPPPQVEWWDKAILPDGSTYDDIETAIDWITTSDDSLITHLIQHPIPIAAPSDKKAPERGLMLTKKEQKKMRRQRRQAELEDKRDRQKMGLLPPDPPKVRLANLMKVLTSDAVQDPTKVEAKVRKEVAMRAYKHEKDNTDRKLTVEERKEKEYQQMLARERKGVYGAVFKIKYLTDGRHKFKVRETANKDHLSGLCIFSPNFALVFVEGADKGIKHYTNLMLRRIDWTEESRPLGEEGSGDDEEDGDAGGGGGGGGGEEGGVKDKDKTKDGPESLVDNKCEVIWEGEVPERTFKQFRARHAETDTRAKEWLTPKWEAMWDVAKRWQWKGEDW